MQHCTTGIEALQLVLKLHCLEDIVRKLNRQLGRVGIIRHVFSRGNDIRIAAHIQHRKAVTRALGGRGLKVIEVSRFFLYFRKHGAHIIEHTHGKRLAFARGQILSKKVHARFVHADDADCVEMIEPILIRTLFYITQIVRRIRIQSTAGLRLNHFALEF
ncbi:hypothetical protein SDC9_125338 [bioreactor metagenome]|uniref:Uncharacterized protein n=1 Tax=bioreactor metagenome TaxID=1076179 RepID=A0A645CN32_9ZZZZ